MAISSGRRCRWHAIVHLRAFPLLRPRLHPRRLGAATDPYLFYVMPHLSRWAGSLSGRNNNAIGLSAYGYDLLETGENGVYDQPHTPVKVDGKEQFFQFGISAWGHRGQMVYHQRLHHAAHLALARLVALRCRGRRLRGQLW